MLKNGYRLWIRKSNTTTNTVAKTQITSCCIRNLSSAPNIQQGTQTKSIKINYLIRNMSSTTEKSQTPPPKAKHTNRLAQEKSPYLLQHAHNPVDWYPWGEEAIERAKHENKLIFLSVGYSTCHWCHVMEHESFENEEVAAIMNANFINIKVDREERPDIDKIYMHFVLMIVGHGGWPMSVWLTPDLAPITGGTYFPPTDRYGMPSFIRVISKIATEWKDNQQHIRETGVSVIKEIRRALTEKSTSSVDTPASAEAYLEEALIIFKRQFDPRNGGFGTKPKFPEVSRINFLFHAYIATKDIDVLDMALTTLRHIGNGGIHDHIFGGFSRYAVDGKWHIPHFEKMLYDQGQLMSSYANAYKLTRESVFLRCADGIFRYLMEDLKHPAGGFYAGEDADSLPKASDKDKVEGAFYSWSWDEIKNAITANATKYKSFEIGTVLNIYAYHYGLRPKGNVEQEFDPHGYLFEKNILIVNGSTQKTCEKFGLSLEQLNQVLGITNKILHSIRSQRPRPHLDTKLICSWNGLVLSGLSKLANCGSDKRDEYLQVAQQLVSFIREHLYDTERKTLLRSTYGVDTSSAELKLLSTESIDGFLDDYAFVIKGLLDYYKASLDGSALKWAKELQDIQDKLFWDENKDAYFYSRADLPNIIVRLKDDHDGAEPCGNSVSARNLILLSHYYDDANYRNRAGRVLKFYNDEPGFGYRLPEMMSALLLNEQGLDLVAVVGPDSETTKSFVEICRKFYIPGMIIVHIDPQHRDEAYNKRVQEKFKMVNGKPTVYICHDRVCRMPVTDPAKLEANLTENFFKSRI